VSTPYQPNTVPPRRLDGALVRELLGALLVVLGMGLVVGAAFMWRTDAGYAALGVALIATGLYLGLSR